MKQTVWILLFLGLFVSSCKTGFHNLEVVVKPGASLAEAIPAADTEASAESAGTGKEGNTDAGKEGDSAENSPAEEPVAELKPIRYVSLGFGIYEYSKAIEPACGQSLQRITMKRDWIDFTIHWFFGGIYSERSVYIHCSP
ncbi:MAG: hypothetical protein AAF518_22205 [Spirochaetota bacterium]